MRWENYTSTELEDLINVKNIRTAILPFGSIEQHGRHLNLNFDSLIAENIANDLAKNRQVFVLPSLKYGESTHHLQFSGTLSLKKSTLKSIMNDIAESLIESGITKLIIINGHGGNYSVLSEFANDFKLKDKIEILHDSNEMLLFRVIEMLKDRYSLEELGYHAGLLETSIGLYMAPEAVREDLICSYDKKEIILHDVQTIISKGLKALYPDGVIGRPEMANIEFGIEVYNIVIGMYDEFFF